MLALNFYQFRWTKHVDEKITLGRDHVWRFNETISAEMSDFRETIYEALQDLKNSSALPKWSSYREALLPVNLTSSLPQEEVEEIPPGNTAHWEVDTEQIRATLQCRSIPQRTSSDADNLHIQFPGSYSSELFGSSETFTKACRDYYRQHASEDQPRGFCAQWTLVHVAPKISTGSEKSQWIINAARIHNDTNASTQPIHCEPQIFTSTGRATLIDDRGRLSSSTLYDFTATSEEVKLENQLAEEYSKMLNLSISELKNSHDPIRRGSSLYMDSPTVSMGRFTGDILSFMAYKWTNQTVDLSTNTEAFAEASSNIFSTIFASAVQRNGFFSVPTPNEVIEVSRVHWVESLEVFRGCLAALVVYSFFISAVLIAHAYVMFRHKEYRFPHAPEPLANSWWYLYASSIVRVMEKIRRPEQLSLQELYSAVDRLKLTYVFGRPREDSLWTRARVDVPENVMEETQWRGQSAAGPRYSDEPEEDDAACQLLRNMDDEEIW